MTFGANRRYKGVNERGRDIHLAVAYEAHPSPAMTRSAFRTRVALFMDPFW